MNLIVAVDKNWAIGNKNELLVNIPRDKKFFERDDDRKSRCNGQKDAGEFSKWYASSKQNQYCFDKK